MTIVLVVVIHFTINGIHKGWQEDLDRLLEHINRGGPRCTGRW